MSFGKTATIGAAQSEVRTPRNRQSGRWFAVATTKRETRVTFRGQADTSSTGLTHGAVRFMPIQSLPDRSIQVIQPLTALVEPMGGVYLASLTGARISASGESPEEAIDSLKDIVAAKFRLFSREESRLGIHPREELCALRQFLRAR